VTINHRCQRIVRVFRWAASEELVSGETFHALKTVPGLARGRTAARECPPVKPVPDEIVEKTIAQLSPILATAVRLLRLTGMRVGELLALRCSPGPRL
jgi:integrase